MNRFLRKVRKNARLRNTFRNPHVLPDEIFLDSKNLPDFDTQQFEGQLERPIPRSALIGVGIFFILVVVVFSGRLWSLQVANGKEYTEQSQRNSLDREPLFAARGNIYDRNGALLAWNDTKTDETPWGTRSYIGPGFAHILGYVGYPAKDKSGNYWQTELTGKDGVEKMYDDVLRGTNGSNIVETDIAGKVQSGNIVDQPIAGKNLTLTIDSRLQLKMHEYLAQAATESGFRSGSAIMMDVQTGEVIVLTNVPEYDPKILSLGKDRAKINEYLTSPRTPLLNRAISGVFTPGSIVKPYLALEALRAGVIDPYTKICSCGSISIGNPYGGAAAVFRDYAANNGMVDMRRALAVSSNIGKAFTRFGLTSKTGIDLLGEKSGSVPSPEWKAARFDGEPWRIGDSYNTAIGQYGVQVTPIEMARSVAAIATRGTLVEPHVFTEKEVVTEKVPDLSDSFYTVVQEGMRLGVLEGTGRALSGLPFTSAAKTGTAQVGAGGMFVNAWLNAYFPYENPRYVVVVVLEHGPQAGLGASQRVGKNFLEWVALNAPEYTK